MRVDFSEPECTCYPYCTSGILNTHQEPEPSNVIDSTVNPTPVISEPVQALGHDDPAAIASISTQPSPIHSSYSPIKTKTGTLTNQDKNRNTTTSAAPPTKPLNSTNFGFSEFAGPKPIWSSNPFDPMKRKSTSSTHCSIPPGFGASSTVLFPSSSSTFSSNRNIGSSSQGSRYHGYGPTQDARDIIGSISASNAYRNRSHKKVTWEDNEQGDKGELFPLPGLSKFLEKRQRNIASSSPASQFGNGVDFARSDVGYTRPNLFEPNQNPSSSSIFPGFGVGYLPGSFSDPFAPTRRNSTASTHCSIPPGFSVKRSLPQPSGFGASTTLFPSSTFSSSSSTKGSRYSGYTPTPDIFDASKRIESISASNAYQKKSHEGLRWEDYEQGHKVVFAPPAHISPIGSRPNAALPSVFASQSISYRPQRTTFEKTGGNMTASAGVTSSSTVLNQTNPPFTGFDTTHDGNMSGFGFGFGSFPSGVTSSSSCHSGHTNAPFTGSRPNAASPSVFDSRSIPHHPQTINFERREETNAPFTGFTTTLFSRSSSSSPVSTTVPAASSSVIQRPHETVVGSSPASSGCCTACGAATTTISSSASGFSTFNGTATTSPSTAATSVFGLFSTSGSSSADMSGTTNLAAQGKNRGVEAFGKNLASQGTQTPTIEAYPTMSGTYLAAQATTTRAFQAYPTRSDWDAELFRFTFLFVFLHVFFLGLMLLF